MNIYYYLDPVLGLCPVKKYLGKFSDEKKLLININSKIKSVASDGYPAPPIARSLIGYPIFEIKQAFKDINIRILCAFFSNELILLHAFDKPRYYNNNEKKVNKDIERNYNIGEKCYNTLKVTKKKYEKYKEEYK